jgi:hypothetical protein
LFFTLFCHSNFVGLAGSDKQSLLFGARFFFLLLFASRAKAMAVRPPSFHFFLRLFGFSVCVNDFGVKAKLKVIGMLSRDTAEQAHVAIERRTSTLRRPRARVLVL